MSGMVKRVLEPFQGKPERLEPRPKERQSHESGLVDQIEERPLFKAKSKQMFNCFWVLYVSKTRFAQIKLCSVVVIYSNLWEKQNNVNCLNYLGLSHDFSGIWTSSDAKHKSSVINSCFVMSVEMLNPKKRSASYLLSQSSADSKLSNENSH